MNILKMIFGTKNARDLKKLRPIVAEINRIEAEYQAKNFTDEDFPRMTAEFKRRLAAKEVTLDGLLPEAFALVKNACRHLMGTTEEVCGHTLTWDMIPFDCQLVGGIVLHQGKIAEMQTGEGKTLVATLPLYLNALAGKNVQLVTVNDYLARRDATSRSTPATSPTAPTASSDSTTCATTAWPSSPTRWCRTATTSPSWTRWTRS